MLDDGRLVSVRVGFMVFRSCGSCLMRGSQRTGVPLATAGLRDQETKRPRRTSHSPSWRPRLWAMWVMVSVFNQTLFDILF